jgi:hypothetical protein
MPGVEARPQDRRSGLPASGRDHTVEDLLVCPDRMVGDLPAVYRDRWGEEDLVLVCRGTAHALGAGRFYTIRFENILSWFTLSLGISQ